MPCRDYMDEGRIVEVDRPSTIKKLCEAYAVLEKHGLMKHISKSGQDWHVAHKKEDEARRLAEIQRLNRAKKKQLILSKLTKEEQRILGLI